MPRCAPTLASRSAPALLCSVLYSLPLCGHAVDLREARGDFSIVNDRPDPARSSSLLRTELRQHAADIPPGLAAWCITPHVRGSGGLWHKQRGWQEAHYLPGSQLPPERTDCYARTERTMLAHSPAWLALALSLKHCAACDGGIASACV